MTPLELKHFSLVCLHLRGSFTFIFVLPVIFETCRICGFGRLGLAVANLITVENAPGLAEKEVWDAERQLAGWVGCERLGSCGVVL